MKAHVASCPDYVSLYRRDPAAALDPGPEFERWEKFEQGAEKAAAREDRIGKLIDGNERKLAAARQRWQTPKDILE